MTSIRQLLSDHSREAMFARFNTRLLSVLPVDPSRSGAFSKVTYCHCPDNVRASRRERMFLGRRNEMIPKFAAEVSLYKTHHVYRGSRITRIGAALVTPAQGCGTVCYLVPYPCASNFDGTVRFCLRQVCMPVPCPSPMMAGGGIGGSAGDILDEPGGNEYLD
jgi:hypothetical protein